MRSAAARNPASDSAAAMSSGRLAVRIRSAAMFWSWPWTPVASLTLCSRPPSSSVMVARVRPPKVSGPPVSAADTRDVTESAERRCSFATRTRCRPEPSLDSAAPWGRRNRQRSTLGATEPARSPRPRRMRRPPGSSVRPHLHEYPSSGGGLVDDAVAGRPWADSACPPPLRPDGAARGVTSTRTC